MAAGSFTASVTELSSGGTSTSQTFTGQTVSRNGGPQARASSTVTIPESPTITSGDTATFALGTAGSFPVTTTGTPPASLSESGALPPGVTFTGDGNGTASLVYDGTASMVGTYPITITASNGTAPDATQAFTLKLDQPPTITSGRQRHLHPRHRRDLPRHHHRHPVGVSLREWSAPAGSHLHR